MEFQLEDAMEVLGRTPAVLTALLDGMPTVWLECRESPDAFSPRDVLGHLIFGEMTDWIPRARIILEHGEARPFDPFDRRGHQPLMAGKPMNELLAQFAALRSDNLAALRALPLDDRALEAAGTHPELGRVTLRALLATWVAHDLGHISQIVRVMASRYREDVGAWRAYLAILQPRPDSRTSPSPLN